MTFPQVISFEPTMYDYGLNEVGEYLGYDWDQICNEIDDAELYAQDGGGSFTISKSYSGPSAILNEIVKAIFNNNPNIASITVIQS